MTTSELLATLREILPQLTPEDREEFLSALDPLRSAAVPAAAMSKLSGPETARSANAGAAQSQPRALAPVPTFQTPLAQAFDRVLAPRSAAVPAAAQPPAIDV